MNNSPVNFTDPTGHTCEDSYDPGCNNWNQNNPYNPIIEWNKSLEKENSPTKVDQKGLDFIAKMEVFIPNLYNDPGGNCTIGIGHLVHLGNCNGAQNENIFKKGITYEEGYRWFLEDIASFENAVKDNIHVSLTQTQFNALVSFTYNVGIGNFLDSTLLEGLNKGNYSTVPSEMKRWVFAYGFTGPAPGLVRRRDLEAQLFSLGIYGIW